MKSSTFHILLNLTYPLRKKISLNPKILKNHPNIFTKPQNRDKQRDLARYWQKGHVNQRQNSLHVYPARL